MEAYAVADLAARAEALQAGLGALVGALAGLVAEPTGPGMPACSFDEIEQRLCVRGRELLRMTAQHALDVQAAAEQRIAGVADAAGVARTRAEGGHARTVVSGVGPLAVRRIAYRAPGTANLYPRDLVLNLPVRRYSWAVQARAVDFALQDSYEQAGAWLSDSIGTMVHKGQIEQIVTEAARDAAGFYAGRDPVPVGPGVPLVLTADGKGVAMRPEARRRGARSPGQRVRMFASRQGTGEKAGHKRMAEIGAVHDLASPAAARTPEQVMAPRAAAAAPAGQPSAVNRWYTADIVGDHR